MLRAAADHPGTSVVEIYQNCPVFNDGAFDALTEKGAREDFVIRLEHGQPVRFGASGEHGVVRGSDGSLRIVDASGLDDSELLVHDARCEDPSLAFALSRLSSGPTQPTPVGVFRSVSRPVWGSGVVGDAGAGDRDADAELEALLHSGDMWTVA